MPLAATFDDNGLCRIVDPEGREVASFETVYSPAFNRQYPPPLSPDEAALYIGTWETGLYCYEVPSGRLVWRQGPGKVRQIFPFDREVIVEMAHRGIYRRTQSTGELTGTIKMSGMEVAIRMSEHRLFAGPFRRHYFVYSIPGLETLEKLSERLLNPDDCLAFSILEAIEIGGRLVVKGWEEYPNGDYAAKGPRKFTRHIKLGTA